MSGKKKMGRPKKQCPSELADTLGVYSDTTLAHLAGVSRNTAARWRIEKGLPAVYHVLCPERKVRKPRATDVAGIGLKAWTLRNDGLTWVQVGQALLPGKNRITARNTAIVTARRYATKNGKQWPIVFRIEGGE